MPEETPIEETPTEPRKEAFDSLAKRIEELTNKHETVQGGSVLPPATPVDSRLSQLQSKLLKGDRLNPAQKSEYYKLMQQ